MSVASLSLPAVALALFLGTAWLCSAALLSVWLRLAGRSASLARHLPAASLVPWLLGASAALATVLPGDPHSGKWLVCHCLESMPAWLHLCPLHPEEAAFLALPALALLAVLIPRRARALRALASEPLGWGGGGQPRVVSLGSPVALLHGWLRPTLVVDQGLWLVLSEAERGAVLAHEHGHLRRRDPLVRVLLRSALVVAPAGLADRTMQCWMGHAERAADAEAARVVGDPLLVAQALLRCARMGARSPSCALAWTGGVLERRVEALLAGRDRPPAARCDVSPPDLLILLGLGALALATTPWVHHQVEHVVNLSL